MSVRILLLLFLISACSKSKTPTTPPPPPADILLKSASIEGINFSSTVHNVSVRPSISFSFNVTPDPGTLPEGIVMTDAVGTRIPLQFSSQGDQKTIQAQPGSPLDFLKKYTVQLNDKLKSTENVSFKSGATYSFHTGIDSTDKFPKISDSALLTKIQQQTFRYFWDFGHPVSGMARERNTSGDVVTTGGTGFGIMSIVVAIHRGFITREQGLARISTIVDFLKTKTEKYHGAFAHWINGATGATVPFSARDDGGDLVETSLLMQGMLVAREYFSGGSPSEVKLRNDINEIWDDIEWTWYQNGQQVLLWHWSKNYGFDINLKIAGWNESLITYVLAASSRTHSIDKTVYTTGWARDGNMRNRNTYYSVVLPLGPPMGGPLFFAHYSFLGLNPHKLKDEYADYWEQNTAHTLINYRYCVDNPKGFFGYSNACWGLTASDDNQKGYAAHSPQNDNGVISPTAAISSLPYLPEQSMEAIHFFYYKLGDRMFKDYGFVDAINLNDLWFANSFLAIDQGPQIVMIENYRSGLVWNLLMNAPEIQSGLQKLGFQ